jgi:hypothetical protein
MKPRRVFRFSSPILAAVLAAPLGAQSPLPAYMPQQAQYRVKVSSHSVQVAMGQTQEAETTVNQLVTVAIAKEGAGLALTMTLDSITQTSTAPVPPLDVSEAIGITLKGGIAPDGHVATSVVTDKTGSPSKLPMAENMRSFLPRLKVGATVGATWADTSNTTRPQGGGTVTTMVITTYTFAGDTTVAGVKHWKINTAAVGTVNGTGNQSGADFTIKGNLTGDGTVVVGTGGALVGSASTNNATLTVDVPMANMQIPITQKETRTITRMP